MPSSTFMRCVGLVAAAPSTVSAASQTSFLQQMRGKVKEGPVRVELANFNNVMYTMPVSFGGTELTILPDTGSFETLSFEDLSHVTSAGNMNSLKVFGMGDDEWSMQSTEAYCDITIQDWSAGNQMLWQAQDSTQYTAGMSPHDADENGIPTIDELGISGLLGLGPPAGGVDIAELDAAAAWTKLDKLKKNGEDTTGLPELCEEYDKVAKFSKTAPTFLSSTGMQQFSYCVGASADTPGYLIFNDDIDTTSMIQGEIIRGLYWSVRVHEFNVISVRGDKHGDNSLGCSKKLGPNMDCHAVLDTGTTFMAAPQDIYDKIVRVVQEFERVIGGCDDVSAFPTITFKIGDEDMELPPSAYIGQVSMTGPKGFTDSGLARIPDKALHHMPHLESFRAEAASKFPHFTGTFCAPLIMSTEVKAQWVFGLPFFRQYYTTFMLAEDSVKAKGIAFAKHDDGCVVGGSSKLSSKSKPMKISLDDLLNNLPQRRSEA